MLLSPIMLSPSKRARMLEINFAVITIKVWHAINISVKCTKLVDRERK
jgi:hypothetical protein